MIVYIIDDMNIFTGKSIKLSEKDPRNKNMIISKPPETEKYAVWDGSKWYVLNEYPKKPKKVPPKITMRQARLALLQSGLLTKIESAINSLDEPQKSAARIEWDYSQEVHRNKEFVSMISIAIGLTQEDLDDLFILGETL